MLNIFIKTLFIIYFISTPSFCFEVKWVVDGLNEPESVLFDKKNNVIYISNINGDPLKLDKNGYISKISVDGQILDKKWITGLDAPKGMAIFNDHLFVADLNKIWKFKISNKKKKSFPINDAGFLNDLVADKNGNIYASDMFKNRIYMLKNETITIWKKSKLLDSPNGLLIEGNNLIIASWGKIKRGFETEIKGKLLKVNLKTREIKRFFSTRPIGNLDGIVFNKDNGYLATDWIKGKLLSINKKGIVTNTFKINEGSSDLEILMHKNLILIPMMKNNNLTAFQYD